MQTQPETLPIGAHAPDFDLPAVDGRRVALTDLADAAVFVYVQACNHCPYVVANVERLTRLARDYDDRGVVFAFVNSNDATTHPDDDVDAMRRFASEHDLPFPYLRDEDQSVARAYRTQRTPEVLVFDRDRRLRYHGRIDDSPKDSFRRHPRGAAGCHRGAVAGARDRGAGDLRGRLHRQVEAGQLPAGPLRAAAPPGRRTGGPARGRIGRD